MMDNEGSLINNAGVQEGILNEIADPKNSTALSRLLSLATELKDESVILRAKNVALESRIFTLELAASAGYTAGSVVIPPGMGRESVNGRIGTMIEPNMPQQAPPPTHLPPTKEQYALYSQGKGAMPSQFAVLQYRQRFEYVRASPKKTPLQLRSFLLLQRRQQQQFVQAMPKTQALFDAFMLEQKLRRFILQQRQPEQFAHFVPEKEAQDLRIILQNRQIEAARYVQMGPQGSQQPQAPVQPPQELRIRESSDSMLGVEVIVLD